MNLTEATIKALNGELNEARSHKEDNERVAPRTSNEKVVGYVKNSPYDEIDVPNRAIYRKGNPNSENGSIWGRYDKDEQSQYENGISQSIQDYKRLKNDAESERHIANYHNALAQQSDDEASDIVRDKKLDRAKKSLQGKQIFKTEDLNKKTESTDDYKESSELRIEFWETESDRNQGYGEIYKYYPEAQKQEAIKDAKKLMRREGYACVEVYNTKTERTEFWTDGNEVNYYGNKIDEGRIPYENDDTKSITFETTIDLNNYTNIDKYIISKIAEYIRQDNTIDKNVSVEQVDKIIAYVFQNGGTELLNKYDDIIYKGMENILEI